MPALDPRLRDLLATIIGKDTADGGARMVAEAGARAAIEALAVHLPAPHAHLDAAGKQLRVRLRARARQLGETRHDTGRYEIGRLVEQAAYEHWHRMLFARFLAENNLLIHPEMKVAVTLEECAELAASEGATDGWELAGRYASRMLPQIFRPDDPLLAVRFAIDAIRKLENLLDSVPAELFRASDSLGWCYQFWQARKKKEINASEARIGADELPAVTQLFTEPYMVQFLLHNTLGAWWVGTGRTLAVEMPYLRRLADGTPAAGTFPGWPRRARDLKLLDPCCGSGHFLVEAFKILVSFRMAEEGLNAQDACDAVLRENLFGLELDARCVQIAAFALALVAWTFQGTDGHRHLSTMNLACSGLSISARKEEWEELGGENVRLRAGMVRLWELFSDAPSLGSLIDPTRDPTDPMFIAGFDEIAPLLTKAMRIERLASAPEDHELMVAARGIADAAALLSDRYTLVATNVPYLTGKRFNGRIKSFIKMGFPDSWYDLSTVFLSRMLRMLQSNGTCAVVVPHNWMFLSSYAEFRRSIISTRSIEFIASLGEEAWITFGNRGPHAVLVSLSESRASADHKFTGLDASGYPSIEAKEAHLKTGVLAQLNQLDCLKNPDRRIVLEKLSQQPILGKYALSMRGIVSGDGDRFTRYFWEISEVGSTWKKLQSAPKPGPLYSGRELVINWSDKGAEMLRPGTKNKAYGRLGAAVAQLRSLHATPYTGELYDNNTGVIVPSDEKLVGAIFAYVSSDEYRAEVRKLDKKKNVTNATLIKVPFDVKHWKDVASKLYPKGLPSPSSNSVDQWIFPGLMRNSASPLHVAVARLVGYCWPDQEIDDLDAHSDADGIVCIPAVRGERPAADRLADLIASAWGQDWHPQILADLLSSVGYKSGLEEWLRDAFFKQHCELFHHRPFIWNIWDGHRDGFSALVNYHKFDHDVLKSLTWSYLGDWIRTQEIEAKAGKSGAADKLTKAKILQQRLASILEGEAPLDIFVRWKPIAQQALGWRPDLDDGVRLNIRPFLTVTDVGASGSGVLRWAPNIAWGKDRGKNRPGSPWGEDRYNDLHLTLAKKRAARGET